MLSSDDYKHNAEYIPTEEFYKRFDIYWEESAVSFKKFEGLQCYDEGPDSPMYDFLNNQLDSFVQKLNAFRDNEKRDMLPKLANGVSFQRLHAVSQPLNDYLKFEYYSYIISSNLGEDIRVIDKSASQIKSVPDFVLFDDRRLLIHDYSNKGRLLGAFDVSDQETIEEVMVAYNKVFTDSEDFRGIMAPDLDLLTQLS